MRTCSRPIRVFQTCSFSLPKRCLPLFSTFLLVSQLKLSKLQLGATLKLVQFRFITTTTTTTDLAPNTKSLAQRVASFVIVLFTQVRLLFPLLSSLISLISRLYLAASFRASPSHSGDEQTWPFLASSKRELLQQARKCAMFPFCYPVPLFPFLWLEFVWQFLAPEASPPTNTNSRLLLHKGSKESQNDIYKDKLDEQTKTSSSSRERNAKTCLASPPTQTHNQ